LLPFLVNKDAYIQSDVTEVNWTDMVWFLMNWPIGRQ